VSGTTLSTADAVIDPLEVSAFTIPTDALEVKRADAMDHLDFHSGP
jgi:hypothetical protein